MMGERNACIATSFDLPISFRKMVLMPMMFILSGFSGECDEDIFERGFCSGKIAKRNPFLFECFYDRENARLIRGISERDRLAVF